ncbi:MAG: HPr family phosphocarrier protein [SAR324 cluster bacterium]|nr:HPr family phosphocarrier protein [SAR324 cluster bacterium]
MHEQRIQIINKLGLHVRAATKLVQTASEYDAEITISCNGQEADAKSIMDVLMLAAIHETYVDINISGENEALERKALSAITTLINDRFGENE